MTHSSQREFKIVVLISGWGFLSTAVKARTLKKLIVEALHF
jgi:hypothetical protein